MKPYNGRPLDSSEAVEAFLKHTLYLNPVEESLVSFIVDSEIGISALAEKKPTLSFKENRVGKFRDEMDRWNLRKKIVEELINLERLGNDDEIELGKGGALPKTSVKSERTAFILIGPPASGKSGLASDIAERYRAVIVDSDYAKRKLPEYKRAFGASLVHSESAGITNGFEKNPYNIKSLNDLCVENGHNLVIPTIGHNYSTLLTLAKDLKNRKGYEVHLILVALSKRKATIRAALRSYDTRRYVPLSLIYDVWGNDPWLTYFYLRCKSPKAFRSFGAISTDVDLGKKGVRIDVRGDSPVAMFDKSEREIEW